MVPMASSAVAFDADLYGAVGRFGGYVSSIPAIDDDAKDNAPALPSRQASSITGHKTALQDLPRDSEENSAGFMVFAKMAGDKWFFTPRIPTKKGSIFRRLLQQASNPEF